MRLSGGELSMVDRRPVGPDDFDHRWLGTLTAKHRVVYDCHSLGDGIPLVKAAAFIDSCREAYGAKPEEVQVVLALHASPAYVAFTDAAWAKYGMGASVRAIDPTTGAIATRNLFASEAAGDPYAAVAVPTLQRRGALFLFCNNVMRNLTSRYARSSGQTPEATRADLIASLLPGVVLVPAVVAATAVAQEHGCTYASIG